MKVLLINPSVGYYTRALSNPLGLLSIGTYLKESGHEVKLFDRCIDRTKMHTVMLDFNPDIVGVSVMSGRGLKDAIKISKEVKKAGKKVVWGGQLPSMQKELVLNNDFVDIVSLGEGEKTWNELLYCIENKEDLKKVSGIAFKENDNIICTPCRDFINLDELPVSDFSLIDVPKYMQTYLGCKKMMYIYSSKGCPCKCTFCSNVSFHKSTHRKRPNEHVISEIKYLIKNYGLDGVYFSDELWCTKRSDMLDFCQRIHDNGMKFHWGVQLRIGIFNKEDFQTMYDAGCRWVLFGIETGSKEMLNKIQKNIDYDKIAEVFAYLKEIGYITIASFIVGFPDETREQLQETVNLIKSIDASLVPVFHFTPLPGTVLYDKVVSEGKYNPIEELDDMCNIVATESLGKNLSCVPDVDLRVIRSWCHWKGFINKNALKTEKSFEFAKQTVLSGLHAISMKGTISFIVNGFSAFQEFVSVFWYSHAYPSILKKYGLK